jgi:hypothetical protein
MAPQTARPAVACRGHTPSHHLHVAEPRQESRREGQQTNEAESTSNVGALATDPVSENTKLRPFGWGFVFDYRRRSFGGSGEPRQEPTVTSAPRAAPHLRDEANTSKWRRTCASRRAASPCRATERQLPAKRSPQAGWIAAIPEFSAAVDCTGVVGTPRTDCCALRSSDISSGLNPSECGRRGKPASRRDPLP